VVDGDGVADADLAEVLDRGDEVAGLADADLLDLGGLGRVLAELGDGEGAPICIMRILSPTLSVPSKTRQ
jgi:hypothetical protein